MKTIVYIGAVGLLVVGLAACDPGSIPNRNVNDVSHEMRTLNETNHQLVVRNPNNVRVGSEFRIRIFREGQRPPLQESVEHVYVSPMMEGTLDIDVSALCGDAAPTGSGEGSADAGPVPCSELSAHAVLLQTYWLADE